MLNIAWYHPSKKINFFRLYRLTERTRITSVITKEAAEEMGIKEGKEITALIKATEVMLMEE